MIYLCDGDPDAKGEGDQIAVSFPSGSGVIEIAMTPHQAMRLSVCAKRAVTGSLDNSRLSAEIIQFRRRALSPPYGSPRKGRADFLWRQP